MSEHHDPMVTTSEEDFTSFLNLGEFQLSFPPLESEGQHASARQDESHAMDMSRDEAGDGGVTARESHMHAQQRQQQNNSNGHQTHSTMALQNMERTSAEVAMGLNAQVNYLHLRQQQQQHQPQQQQDYRQQSVIPPTPDSAEIHASAARYYQQMEHQSLAYLERLHQQRLKEDQQVQ